MNRFPRLGDRIRSRLRALGYWKNGRPDVARFCQDKGYRAQYVYAWLKHRMPGDENFRRLSRDLRVPRAWLMLGRDGEAAPEPEPARATALAEAAPAAARGGGPPRRGAGAPREEPGWEPQILDFERLREVTDRLTELEAQLETIFVAFPDRYVWIDAGGRIVGARGAGSPGVGVAGKEIAQVWPPPAAGAITAALGEARARGPVSVEYTLASGEGARSFEVRVLPLARRRAGAPVLAIERDITERKNAERALRLSEARYRAIVEEQTELICRYRPDGTLTFVNEVYARYFGATPAMLVGRSVLPLVSAEDRDRVLRHIASLSPSRPWATIEHRVRLPGGEARWQAWTDRALFDEQGAVVELQAVGRDITDLKRAEEALRDREALFRAIFQEAAIGISLVGLDGRVVASNRAFQAMLGGPGEPLVPRAFTSDLHAEDAPVVAARWGELIDGRRQDFTLAVRYLAAGGRCVRAHLVVRLVRGVEGRPVFALGMAQAVGERA